jgi:predicted permease
MRELGDFTRAREATSDTIGGAWLEHFLHDIRRAVRSLLHAPGFTLAATLTLVIGIGASIAAFSIVQGVLLDPMPYPQPDRLVDVWQDVHWPAARRIPQNPALYFTYKAHARTIESIGLYQGVGNANIADAGAAANPERVAATWMTATIFPTLQVRPVLGRVFTDDDDRMHVPNVIVISDAIWRECFGGNPDVVGKTLIVNDIPREIVGVMPANFHFPTPAVKLWLPARLEASNPNTRGRADDFSFNAVARLRDGVSVEQAQSDLASVVPRVAEMFPEFATGVTTQQWLDRARPTPAIVPMKKDATRDIAGTIWILAATAAVVLLVACANVVNLLLIRADGRRVQLAVRHALGASPIRIMSYFLAEALALAGVAGSLGLTVAAAAIRAFAVWGATTIPRASELGVDAKTLVIAAAITGMVAIICTVVPALRTAATPLFAVVREGSLNTTSGKAQHRFRSAIAGLQIALALVALNSSALLLRTYQKLHTVHPGFDATNVSTYWMQLPVVRNPGDSAVTSFYAQLVAAASTVPGVRSVGVTSQVPLGRSDARMRDFFAEDATALHESLRTCNADSGYFNTLRIPLLAGRLFAGMLTQSDRDVVVSRQVALDFWNDSTGTAALGKRIRLVDGGPAYSIIGVVGDVRDRSLELPPQPTVYFAETLTSGPMDAQHANRTMALVVRTADGRPPTSQIKRIVRQLNPTLPMFDVLDMQDVMSRSMARLSVTMVLLSAAAAIALALGMIGLYGIMDYVVALRTREIGLRVVLGANPGRIARMMTQEGVVVALVGIAVGVALFSAVARFLRSFVYDVSISDPATLIGTSLALLAIAALASWLPARRAARIDPNIVLRS